MSKEVLKELKEQIKKAEGELETLRDNNVKLEDELESEIGVDDGQT